MATPFSHVIPSLSSLSLVTDYSHAISPFCESFINNLPLLNPASSNFSPSSFYHTTNPFFTAALLSQAFGVFTFLLSSITGNYSQVDRLWSILPTVYIAHFTYFAHSLGLPTSRLDTLLTVALVWSIRLTFNYWRKGGYQVGHEDYRWTHVRQMVPQPWAKVLFNMVFVSWFQNTLLFLISTPAYLFLLIAALPATAVPESAGDIHKFGTVDLIFSRAIGLALLAEFFADQQQWGFHKAKKAYEQSGKTVVPEGWEKADLDRGFCVVGLWSFSRHPNFVAEQAFWVLIYQWACFVTDTVYNYTALGVIFYCMVFQGSTMLTEKISSGKYREYKEYQRLVGRFLPKLSAFWDTSSSEEEDRKTR